MLGSQIVAMTSSVLIVVRVGAQALPLAAIAAVYVLCLGGAVALCWDQHVSKRPASPAFLAWRLAQQPPQVAERVRTDAVNWPERGSELTLPIFEILIRDAREALALPGTRAVISAAIRRDQVRALKAASSLGEGVPLEA